MEKRLSQICDSLKRIFNQLKPQTTPLSFVLLTGKKDQGKTTLLRQSNLTVYPLNDEDSVNLYYNNKGVILELGETWFNQSDNLISYTLKQLNKCHPLVKISGFILAIDSNELLHIEPSHLIEHCKAHTDLLYRFGEALTYPVDISFIFTKLDAMAGFCEFFQGDHPTELCKPLGFSLENIKQRNKLIENSRLKFEAMIEVLSQQIINKLHPARSTVKRSLIREFPLQLTSLRVPLLSLIQNLALNWFRLKAVYFTSGEQGGVCLDRLNQKIQHEYALVVQDRYTQSNNYRPYFIEGALLAIQDQTKRQSEGLPILHKWLIGATAGTVSLLILTMLNQHFKSTRLLDEASKELLAYEALHQDKGDAKALYHLSKANVKLSQVPSHFLASSSLSKLKSKLNKSAEHQIYHNFLPKLLAALEESMSAPQKNQVERYQALKVYLMLGNNQYYSETEVVNWFKAFWLKDEDSKEISKELSLLKDILKTPLTKVDINKQIVLDTRNYLNALPPTYLYYSLAKNQFPSQKTAITIEGFSLPTTELPFYYTKLGFHEVISTIPQIANKLQAENWVLARQDLASLPQQLQEAYCFEYTTWWQGFINHTKPLHYQNFKQAKELTTLLYQKNSFSQLISLIQSETSPELDSTKSVFNEKVASQFTNFNLLSTLATKELSQNIIELEKFLTTLSFVKDDGHTVFDLTKARFQDNIQSDPISVLYTKAKQLPEPIASWTKQLADDSWYILVSDSKNYINKQWKENIFNSYEKNIANRYPLNANEEKEIALDEFNSFFSPQGKLNQFVANYIKPFLDTSTPQWKSKEIDGYVLPISTELLDELMRANVISNMFFPNNEAKSKIEFSLQKINLDPIVANLTLSIGNTQLLDDQNSDSYTDFQWPSINAKLVLSSIEGNHFELDETGPWAFFKMLQKVNVLVDANDSSSLQILFEINGNSGRYLLKTQNLINPFSPGILTGFQLTETIA
ncbi:MAG: type IVB secretion system protein IcmF [Proteobacteria bacterium]|nr:type IVB secretion system protein IcmF [Pseudomonadota bacterium]